MSKLSKIYIATGILLSSTPAHADEILGSYSLSERGISGSMLVTDISACEEKHELGCTSAVRPLKVKIEVENQQGAEKCNLDLSEITVGRIQSSSEINASFKLDKNETSKEGVDIVFHRRSAIVSKSSAGCASKVDVSGTWKKVAADAACVPKKIIFSCIAKGGKKIEVCDQGQKIRYSFGKEMILQVDRKDTSTYQWNGVGRSMTYMIKVPSKDVEYEVFVSVDRLTDKHEIDAGVSVLKGDKTLTTVKCTERDLENNIEGIDLKRYE